jgi:hypothetical protein
VQPARVEMVRLDKAMSLTEFHRRYPSSIELKQLAIINGLEENSQLAKGAYVKRVKGGEIP